jgi:ATP-binding cassette subfamily F protein uup
MDYDGTLFLVSHDRAFLDNVVTQVIAFEGGGTLREYVGGYSDWQRQRRAPAAKEEPKAAAPKAAATPRDKSKTAKLSFKETRELESLPGTIDALEREQAGITAQLANGDIYRDDPDRAKALQQRYAAIEKALMEGLARWEALEAKQKALSAGS